MGEASGSQLRIWYHALPSLVTDVGWYSSLSRDTVAHVRPEHEVADIQSHLQAFLNNPEPFAQMGQRGLRILREQHDPEKYVQTILDFAANAGQFRVRKTAYDLARKVGELIGPWNNENGDTPKRVAERIFQICGP
jgi:hypothetical protein